MPNKKTLKRAGVFALYFAYITTIIAFSAAFGGYASSPIVLVLALLFSFSIIVLVIISIIPIPGYEFEATMGILSGALLSLVLALIYSYVSISHPTTQYLSRNLFPLDSFSLISPNGTELYIGIGNYVRFYSYNNSSSTACISYAALTLETFNYTTQTNQSKLIYVYNASQVKRLYNNIGPYGIETCSYTGCSEIQIPNNKTLLCPSIEAASR